MKCLRWPSKKNCHLWVVVFTLRCIIDMEQPKQPQYLTTDAPGDDLYDGKPQERVAQAVAGVIREDQFKLLGLDGTWGAGKSNVIRILQRLLKGTHHFFVYDAWSHQEDPQRRVFLEEFTEDLIN